jgi:hypothetical protein
MNIAGFGVVIDCPKPGATEGVAIRIAMDK